MEWDKQQAEKVQQMLDAEIMRKIFPPMSTETTTTEYYGMPIRPLPAYEISPTGEMAGLSKQARIVNAAAALMCDLVDRQGIDPESLGPLSKKLWKELNS